MHVICLSHIDFTSFMACIGLPSPIFAETRLRLCPCWKGPIRCPASLLHCGRTSFPSAQSLGCREDRSRRTCGRTRPPTPEGSKQPPTHCSQTTTIQYTPLPQNLKSTMFKCFTGIHSVFRSFLQHMFEGGGTLRLKWVPIYRYIYSHGCGMCTWEIVSKGVCKFKCLQTSLPSRIED